MPGLTAWGKCSARAALTPVKNNIKIKRLQEHSEAAEKVPF